MRKYNVLEVSQFFEWGSMSWKELSEMKDKGVLPSTDKSCFLWTETPKLKEVQESEEPLIGDVWLINDGGKPIIFKCNIDSSD